ncbi:PEP-CTERM sorting domain-containing protein [Rubritalea sp.]|uniref:PEP-CTERM sorting domain-containing protein n=1 Tax=Rubritalea sp. TaxID=2109375 RepID=UPI003EF5F724
MKTKNYSPLVASLLLTLNVSGNASITIDDFSTAVTGSNVIDIYSTPTPATPTTISTVGTGLTGVIGGQRNITLTRITATGSGRRQVTTTVENTGNSYFEYSSTSGASGSTTLSYGQGTDASLAGFNLSSAYAFDINFVDYDLPGGNLLTVAISVTSGGSSTSVSKSLTTNGGLLSYNFSEFSGADFSDVDQIDLVITAPSGADYSIDSFTAVTAAVPEPSSAILLGLGLSFGLVRRRR